MIAATKTVTRMKRSRSRRCHRYASFRPSATGSTPCCRSRWAAFMNAKSASAARSFASFDTPGDPRWVSQPSRKRIARRAKLSGSYENVFGTQQASPGGRSQRRVSHSDEKAAIVRGALRLFSTGRERAESIAGIHAETSCLGVSRQASERCDG